MSLKTNTLKVDALQLFVDIFYELTEIRWVKGWIGTTKRKKIRTYFWDCNVSNFSDCFSITNLFMLRCHFILGSESVRLELKGKFG